jgi:hypothetical protein
MRLRRFLDRKPVFSHQGGEDARAEEKRPGFLLQKSVVAMYGMASLGCAATAVHGAVTGGPVLGPGTLALAAGGLAYANYRILKSRQRQGRSDRPRPDRDPWRREP